jgi:AbrB family looped-hinge helix DNA binding protein
MHEAKLSSKNQVVIPRAVREALGVKSGDRLLMVVRGETVILLPRPKKYSSAISGIGKGAYPDEYLNKERESWG